MDCDLRGEAVSGQLQMCRIAGQIANGSSVTQILGRVKRMCSTLAHGGPDDEGFFSDEDAHLVFGHRRLSIIDLSSNGRQPMADVDGNVHITFNGEIYNYPELKAALINLGARFHSATDTEVIIQAYLHWGESAFGKLRGIFAFALYDRVNQLTYLVRDSNGIKPLYYYPANGQLSFSSEVSALQISGIATETDPAWQVRFLAYGHIPEPYTTLKNVYSLHKGHFLRWDNKRNIYKINKYITFLLSYERITSYTEACELIRQSFQKAVSRQLIADAQIGVFLSGGIDSSLITLLANKQQKADLKTISVCFNEKSYDESQYQNLVFDKIEGEKHTHLVKQEDFEAYIPQIIQAMDMPTTDGINTWFISKYAHDDGLKAVLSGVGADELFGGYPSFNRIQYVSWLKQVPAFLLSSVLPLAPVKYRKIGYLAHDNPLSVYLSLRGLFAPDEIAGILDIGHKEITDILFRDHPVAPISAYNEEYASWMESNFYMQNQLLRDTDVMSMSHGLEVRVPFLDEDFQRQVYAISPELRFNKQQGKKLLIDSFSDILPDAVWNRPKMGFTFPLQQWMRQFREISNPNQYHNKTARHFIKNFNRNEVHWSKIFALYQCLKS
ncbi:MAG: asparagine synthase (glutamine-hydrolyzing) [Mucilaginibacter sp.]